MAKITFVTGTDTGVGKTVLTALLLEHLRSSGIKALAMKPFCSGSRSDARLLRKLGGNQLTLDEVNPYYFEKPLAPFAAAWPARRKISIDNVVQRIHRVGDRCDHLLVEGVGGVLVPLGNDFFVADIIAALSCEILLVARNELGTINHTLLSVRALDDASRCRLNIVLMNSRLRDESSKTNAAILQHFLHGIQICEFPFIGHRAKNVATIRARSRHLEKRLDMLAHA